MNPGQIITFYSYKGGVGRTMALVNIASILTQWDKKVLMVDWDLEAPGIESYFSKFKKSSASNSKGIIDVLTNADISKTKWKEYVERISNPKIGEIHLLKSGKNSKGYHDRIRNLDIGDFYEFNSGFKIIEQLRNEWKSNYDFILIDSRTGITDNGGICTIHLPDVVVLLFTTNNQSLEGTKDVVDRANHKHQSLPFDRQNIITIPIVARFDNSTEFQISQEWISKIATYLVDVFDGWLPAKVDKKEFIEKTKIPYIPYFSFGEKISILEQGVTDPSGMGYAYESIASLIANRFEQIEEFLEDRSQYISRIRKGLETNIDFDRDNISEQLLNSNSFDRMLNIYEEAVSKKKLSTGILNTLIERAPDFRYAMQFYEDMRSQGIHPSEITFNNLIKIAPDFQYAMQFYKDMNSLGIRPSEITFNNLIKITPDFQYTMQVYEDMRIQGIRPSEITFNNLIKKTPDFQYAMQFYEDMRIQGIRPSEITFNNLINKSPDFKYAMQFYEDMRIEGIRPSEITFNNLINKSPDFKYAMQFYDDMRIQGIRPSEITFNNLIYKSPDFKYAMQFYEDMRIQRIRPSEITFNDLINKSPDFNYAMQFYDDMRIQGIRPSEITFNNLIKKAPDFQYTMKFYEDMRSQGIRPSNTTYRTLGNVLSKFGKTNLVVSLLMEEMNRDPNSITLNLELAEIYKKQKKLEEAKAIYYKVLKLSPRNNIALKEIKKIDSKK